MLLNIIWIGLCVFLKEHKEMFLCSFSFLFISVADCPRQDFGLLERNKNTTLHTMNLSNGRSCIQVDIVKLRGDNKYTVYLKKNLLK